jgi:uncharacterized protein
LAPITRRKFLQLTAGAGVVALGVDSAVLEPNHPQLVRLEIPLARLPEGFDGFTIVQLSDFHYDPYLSIIAIRRAVEMTNQLSPDLVVLTGDFVTVPVWGRFRDRSHAALTAEPCANLLSQIRAPMGRFCVLGNHDASSHKRLITEILNSYRLPVLDNQSFPLERNGARLWLVGVDDCLDGQPDIELALKGIPPNEAVIMLVHEPDVADRVNTYPVDLQLSGHSHGGQVWIPGIGAPWLPKLAHKYPRGLRQVGPLTLYTNFGLGTIRVPVRLNCPPEVTLITLRAGQGSPVHLDNQSQL